MTCTYSDPVVLDQNGDLITPTDNSLPFVFQQVDCEVLPASGSSEVISSVDITSDSSLAVGLSEYFRVQSFFFIVILFISMYFIGYSFYKR